MFRWGEGNAGLQWKERGAGDFRLLKHKESGIVRAVMRREKTLKLCANHICKRPISRLPALRVCHVLKTQETDNQSRAHSAEVSEEMKLESTMGSDRAFVYNCYVDFSEEAPSAETLAIRFKDADRECRVRACVRACVCRVCVCVCVCVSRAIQSLP
jgi:Ran-binding protein 1